MTGDVAEARKTLQFLQDIMYEKLTKWEQEFVDSVLDQIENRDSISSKQGDVVEKLRGKYVRVASV